ncbi:MAG: ScyD/ScyE family protein [Gammaproteobacteria bacterium]
MDVPRIRGLSLAAVATGAAALGATGHLNAQVIGGFQGPLFGLATAPNGDLLVADASTGIVPVRNGVIGDPVPQPGVTDVSPIGRSSLWVLTGAAGNAQADSGQGLHRASNGQSRKLINLWDYEETNNPAPPAEVPDSNPFDVESLGGDTALVADAGGNDLLWIDNQGNPTLLAVFPNELVSTDNVKSLFGCPSPAPLCGLPPELPAQPVPTSVAVGPDGNYYVGELKGFPAPTNESNIWRVSPGASAAACGASADCVKVFDGGFTSIIDMTFGPDGLLYVAEMDEDSWAAVEILGVFNGGSINACDVMAAVPSCVQVATGILELTAITFGKDGSLWATQHSLVPGGAEVVRIF